MPPRHPAPAPSPTPAAAGPAAGPGAAARWALALAAPAVPLAVVILAHLPATPEVLRLTLLLVTAIVGVAFGSAPAVLTALVAAALGWYRPDAGRWVVDPVADGPAIAAFVATALVVALTAGARRGAAVSARWLQQELATATGESAEHRQIAERLAAETAALRAEARRTAGELAEARAAADRATRSRKAILDSLPPELRAPHVVPPTALQLFPPLLAAAPIGVAPPPMGPDVGSRPPDDETGVT